VARSSARLTLDCATQLPPACHQSARTTNLFWRRMMTKKQTLARARRRLPRLLVLLLMGDERADQERLT